LELSLFGPKSIKKPAVKTAGYEARLVPKAGIEKLIMISTSY